MSETTMKALLLSQHGDLSELKVVYDYPRPQVIEGHVVIRVGASSFNYHDVFTVRGMPGIKVPLPVIIGLDMAGEIVDVGAGVEGWAPGDRVLVNPLNKKKGLMGEMLNGGMAEYCLVSSDQLIRMPDQVTYEEAASLPVAYGTAHRMIVTHNTIKARCWCLVRAVAWAPAASSWPSCWAPRSSPAQAAKTKWPG
jgi:NADPH:quinone reductase-like Zn-dependent oxidoreductase